MLELSYIQNAQKRISSSIIRTPLIHHEDSRFGKIFLKLDQLQITGSFKERGAVNKLKTIKDEGKFQGVISASAGNHAQAVACHGARLGFSVSMVMPQYTPTVKINATEKWGAQIQLEGETVDEGIKIAKKIAQEKNLAFVHAFDDLDVMAGQGTMALEILEELPDLDCMLVPVGGGGLISGIAVAIKSLRPSCTVIGVQTEKYPQVTEAFYGSTPKKPVGETSTIADGIAVKGIGELTLPILKKYVDDMITISDDEIADGIFHLLQHKKILSEGAGAVAFAAVLSGKFPLQKYSCVATTICGGNIDMNLLSRIIEKGFLKRKQLLKVNVVISDRPGSLHKLTGILKDMHVSILQIEHDRASTSIPYYNAGTNLLLETRNEDHYNKVIQELQKHCSQVSVLH